jgi:hypothetical protein
MEEMSAGSKRKKKGREYVFAASTHGMIFLCKKEKKTTHILI